jgi:outer membrane protein assembly factor BamA
MKIKAFKKVHVERSLFGLLFFFILLSSIPVFAQSSEKFVLGEKDSTLRIEEIKIARRNVFDPEIKEENKKLYLWVNKFHFLTKERIIRQELLFKEGDIYDKKLLEESERNLRDLGFLGKVKIEETRKDNHKVDISVKTQDQWSTTVSFSGEAVGKYYSLQTYFEEHNLLGWGKGLILGYTRTTERENGQLSLMDGNILGTRLFLYTDIYNRSDGHLYNIAFSRPFYSLETKYSFGSRYLDEDSKVKYYREGKDIFSYRLKNEQFYFELSQSSGKNWKKIFSPFYQSENKDYSFYSYQDSSEYVEFLPSNRNLQHLGFSLKLWHPQYEKLSYVDNFGSIEDIDFGFNIQGEWGLNVNNLFSQKRTDIFSFKFILPLCLRNNQYLFFSHSTRGEFENQRWERMLSQTEMRFYWRILQWQTLAFRTLEVLSSRRDKSFQLFLDGTTGLRGFEKYRFAGKNNMVINFEDRIFSPWKILTVALGGVLFFDAGYVWNENLAGQKLHTDVGAGLRFGFTKSNAWRVTRLDFAKSLETNDWVISFATGMYFELKEM